MLLANVEAPSHEPRPRIDPFEAEQTWQASDLRDGEGCDRFAHVACSVLPACRFTMAIMMPAATMLAATLARIGSV